MKARKSALVMFKTNITAGNLCNFRMARAKARRACCDNKRASWHQYVFRLNSGTTLSSLLWIWSVESVAHIKPALVHILNLTTVILMIETDL